MIPVKHEITELGDAWVGRQVRECRTGNPGIGDNDVDISVSLLDLCDGSLKVNLLGDVALNSADVSMFLHDHDNEKLALVILSIAQ